MIVVIQCASSKQDGAGAMRTRDGRRVLFVANPRLAPRTPGILYARPDETSDAGGTWREQVAAINSRGEATGLLAASDLYSNATYRFLVDSLGADRVYILSAGWGLVPSTFRIPDYDITFKRNVEPYKVRDLRERWCDFRMLPAGSDEPVAFLGGKDYVPFFTALTAAIKAPRTVYYNSASPPSAPGCRLVRYQTSTRTNWHYECARWLVSGGQPPQASPASTPVRAAAAQPAPQRITRPAGAGAATTADFRTLLRRLFAEAATAGRDSIEVKSGDLHTRLGAVSRMPSACGAMRSEIASGDKILEQPPSGNGTRFVVRYRLPRR